MSWLSRFPLSVCSVCRNIGSSPGLPDTVYQKYRLPHAFISFLSIRPLYRFYPYWKKAEYRNKDTLIYLTRLLTIITISLQLFASGCAGEPFIKIIYYNVYLKKTTCYGVDHVKHSAVIFKLFHNSKRKTHKECRIFVKQNF